ncbi:hypothetical protein MVES1_001837 [Malassezia vespertilionis]|uniref:uncharacterized protein n=1 Tax=Malassezia vespertilionis TaxID=2020962 RepID=UPI0024B1D627|nr:uncharacterized protein MVES1_001837 [Malassezia vespertilionis]WFD06492.1 hypothetical protein MVES1_001837 [Malassezia vespertilionis]
MAEPSHLEGQQHKFEPFEVSPAHVVYAALGLFIAIFSMFSMLFKERLYLGEAPIALIFGIIIGPVAAQIFDPSSWGEQEHNITPGTKTTNEITLEVMRVCVALSVFAVGVELPKKYVFRHWRSIAMLLGPVMLWGWLISSLLIWALMPGLDFLNSLVIGSCLSPTDPILAQAVVGGPWAEKNVPAHIRHMLQCESGCNDGAAFPFLFLAYYLTVNRGQIGFPVAKWFYLTWAWEICFGTFIGALMGYIARKAIRYSEQHKLVDRESFVAQYVSLAMASMGANILLGSDDLLAAFACGTAFAWDGWFQKQTEDSNFSSIIDLLFNIATFVYIGAVMPWRSFNDGEIGISVWRLVVMTILILLLKRIPIVILLWKWVPDIKTFHEAMFAGYFGPMGVGAIFMCTYGRILLEYGQKFPPETTNDYLAFNIQPVVYFLVLSSTIVHGFTIPFFAFGRRAHVNIHRTLTRAPSYGYSAYRTLTVNGDGAGPTNGMSVAEAMHRARKKQAEEEEEEEESGEISERRSHHSVASGHTSLGTVQRPASERASFHPLMDNDPDEEALHAYGDDDWGGDDTAEARVAMEMLEKKGDVSPEDLEKDISEALQQHADDETPIDIHDKAKIEDDDAHCIREWVEGRNIVIEYQKHPGDEPETIVVPIPEDDYEEMCREELPFRAMLRHYSDKIESLLGWSNQGEKRVYELDSNMLYKQGITHRIAKRMKELTEGRTNEKDKELPVHHQDVRNGSPGSNTTRPLPNSVATSRSVPPVNTVPEPAPQVEEPVPALQVSVAPLHVEPRVQFNVSDSRISQAK